MKVLNKFIVIERILDKNERKSGLIMTVEDTRELRYNRAKVVKVGPLVEGMSTGDEIYFDKVAGHDVLIDDIRLTVIQEKDVVCVL
jgi:co-chaperonin GroES (HSP10)